MSDPNILLHAAARWFTEAILAHVREHPKQCDGWLEDFKAGRAGATVTVEIVPYPQILCGFQIGDQVIVFHRQPLTERKGPAN